MWLAHCGLDFTCTGCKMTYFCIAKHNYHWNVQHYWSWEWYL